MLGTIDPCPLKFVSKFVDPEGLESVLGQRWPQNVLLGVDQNVQRPQLIIAVVDACQLSRSLYLIFELKKLNLPMIVALNLFDLAEKRGQKLDLVKLEADLGLPPVVPSKDF